MSKSEIDLSARLERLESSFADAQRSLRRYRLMGTGLVMGVVGLGLLAAAQNAPKLVQAHKIEILDDEGRVLLALGGNAEQTQPQIDFNSHDGRNVMRLGVNDHGGDISIWNSEGTSLFGAYAAESGGRLGLWKSNGRQTIAAGADTHGGRLDVYASDGQIAATSRASGTGGEFIANSISGRSAFMAGAGQHGGVLTILNADHRIIGQLASDSRGAAALNLTDRGGGDYLTASLGTHGGELALLNRQSKPIWAARVANSNGLGETTIFNDTGEGVVRTTADNAGNGMFLIADDNGHLVYSVNAISDVGAAMQMLNAQGERLLVAGTRPQGGLLNLMNSRGINVLVAGAAENGLDGAVIVKNARGVAVCELAADTAYNGIVTLRDADGRSEEVLEVPTGVIRRTGHP